MEQRNWPLPEGNVLRLETGSWSSQGSTRTGTGTSNEPERFDFNDSNYSKIHKKKINLNEKYIFDISSYDFKPIETWYAKSTHISIY